MKEKRKIVIVHVLLTVVTLLLLFVPLGTTYFFGSEGDWHSQHVGIAESIRQVMLETKQLIPQFIRLGGGSNIYDFAYYGLLRPDILLSCLLPDVEMKYIIAAYAAIGVVASVNLGCLWLRRQKLSVFFAFSGALLLASSTCFYQAHHQIMFVNYMPFLILALLGVDRLLEKRRAWLLIFALFMIYIHSFYYSISCLFVVGIYLLHQLRQKKEIQDIIALGQVKKLIAVTAREVGILISAAAVSIGMAAVLLIPMAIDIFSNEKDTGSFMAASFDLLDGGLTGLLYTPYGCGMTMLTLYCLLLSLTKRRKRFLSVTLFVCMLFPAVSYVLNGFLYARVKILMPFVLLFVLLAADTLQDLYQGKQRPSLCLLACCVVPAFFSAWKVFVLVDCAVILLWLFILKAGSSFPGKRAKQCVFSFIYLVPLLFNLCLNMSDDPLNPVSVKLGIRTSGEYIRKDDTRQQHFTLQEISDFVEDREYRFDVLANNFVNCNLLPDGTINKAAMYSSVTNTPYARFYYNTMRNPISINNRVALTPSTNPFFLYFMGEKYLLTDSENIPEGYEVVAEKNGYVLVQNENVLPVCYGTVNLVSEEEYGQLDFPETLGMLCSSAVVPEDRSDVDIQMTDKAGGDENREMKKRDFGLQRPDTEQFFRNGGKEKLMNPSGKAESYVLDLQKAISNKILIIRFHVESMDGKAVEIKINGMKNKLSAKSVPYPNRNNDFIYIISAGKPLRQLSVEASEGKYKIDELQMYTLDRKVLHHEIIRADSDGSRQEDGRSVYSGQIAMEKAGYFITSYPYRKGYRIEVDGNPVKACKVNTAFLGFPLEAGEHRIEIAYEAPGFGAGLVISILSVVLGMCYKEDILPPSI